MPSRKLSNIIYLSVDMENYTYEQEQVIITLMSELDMQENQEVSNSILIMLEYFMTPDDFDDFIGEYTAVFINQ